MESLFYELMQVSTGQLDCLSRGPSPEEWQQLYALSQRQAVTGICYKGVEKLFEFGLRAPQDVSIDWMSEAEEIRLGNTIVEKRCATLQKRLIERKIHTSVLLGQGIAHCYDEELQELRQPSGIDVYVDCGREKAAKFVSQTGQSTVRQNNHVVWLDKWADTPVRFMLQVAYSKNPFNDKAIQRWFRQNRSMLFENNNGLIMPAEGLHLVYVLYSLHQNLLVGHADMRMLMDCFVIMKQCGGRPLSFAEGMTVEKVMKLFGIANFARGIMWIMQRVFKADSKLLPMEPLQEEGAFILQQVMGGRHMLQLFTHYPVQMFWNLF